MLHDSRNATSSFTYKIKINNRPQLEEGKKEVSTELTVFTGSKHIIPIPLPKTSDIDGDQVTISFYNLPPYLTMDIVQG